MGARGVLDAAVRAAGGVLDRVDACSLQSSGAESRRSLSHATALQRAFVRRVDAAELDVAIAATLVGLATGPFRIQQPHWPDAARRHLQVAERLVHGAREEVLTATS